MPFFGLPNSARARLADQLFSSHFILHLMRRRQGNCHLVGDISTGSLSDKREPSTVWFRAPRTNDTRDSMSQSINQSEHEGWHSPFEKRARLWERPKHRWT